MPAHLAALYGAGAGPAWLRDDDAAGDGGGGSGGGGVPGPAGQHQHQHQHQEGGGGGSIVQRLWTWVRQQCTDSAAAAAATAGHPGYSLRQLLAPDPQLVAAAAALGPAQHQALLDRWTALRKRWAGAAQPAAPGPPAAARWQERAALGRRGPVQPVQQRRQQRRRPAAVGPRRWGQRWREFYHDQRNAGGRAASRCGARPPPTARLRPAARTRRAALGVQHG